MRIFFRLGQSPHIDVLWKSAPMVSTCTHFDSKRDSSMLYNRPAVSQSQPTPTHKSTSVIGRLEFGRPIHYCVFRSHQSPQVFGRQVEFRSIIPSKKEKGKGKVRRPETDVLPLSHATNRKKENRDKILFCLWKPESSTQTAANR